MAEPRTFTVSEDDDGIRLDRWFKRHMADISFNLVSRWARTGQLRVNGKRAVPGDRIEAGQEIRIPPAEATPARTARPQPKCEQLSGDEIEFVRDMVIHEDPNAFVLNKPPGLATQGGTKTDKHLDRLLDGLSDERGRPKLVHRLDKDTSGALLVARTARSAGHFAKAFSGRTARKVYWALVVGVPSAFSPEVRRQDQLRAHMAALGHPIVGDAKYGGPEAFLTGGISRKLHLHARRLRIDAPDGTIDVTADLPAHIAESLATLGFDAALGDKVPSVGAPPRQRPAKPRRETRRGERRSRGSKSNVRRR